MVMPKSARSQENSNMNTGGEVRRGVFRPSRDSSAFWGEFRRQRTIQQMEPSGKAKPEKIKQYLEKFE